MQSSLQKYYVTRLLVTSVTKKAGKKFSLSTCGSFLLLLFFLITDYMAVMFWSRHTLLSRAASLLADSILSMSRSFFSESTCLSAAWSKHFTSSTSLRRTEHEKRIEINVRWIWVLPLLCKRRLLNSSLNKVHECMYNHKMKTIIVKW